MNENDIVHYILLSLISGIAIIVSMEMILYGVMKAFKLLKI